MLQPPPPRDLVLFYVEDHQASIRVLEHVLELRPEWRMVHAGGIRAARETLTTVHPDLVLLDVHLPDGTGVEVLSTLKQDPTTAPIPVVVLTAGTTETLTHEMLDAGADLYWTKPLDLQALLDLLDDTAHDAR